MNCLPYVARVLLPILFILVEGGNVLAADSQKADSLPGAIPPEIEKSLRLAADENRDLSDRMPVALKELIERDKSHHDVLAALVAAMKDKDARIRCASVYVVGFLAPKQKTLLPVVERLIDDKDLRVRLAACESAWTIGRSEKAVRAASALLDNPADNVRFYAASLIADMGEGAVSAAPKLVDRLSEPNELIGLCVGKALDKMGRAALEPLLKKTNDPSAQVRQLAIAYLGSIKIADPRITGAILVAMDDTNWEVRHSAVMAVEDLQIRGPLVTEKLMARLNDPEAMICIAAAKTLAKMGVKKAVPSLEKAIVERHMSADREEIAWCLGKLRAVSAIPTLEKMLLQKTTVPSYSYGYDATSKMYSMTVEGTTTKYETDRSVRVAIVTALGEMGPAAIPALERARNDPEQSVREAAAESLQRISSETKGGDSTSNSNIGECERHRLRKCRSRYMRCAGSRAAAHG